tara:strand:+ start:337 stop:714 length:378 start_codon:yes stop_codon:yes gene_type:complete
MSILSTYTVNLPNGSQGTLLDFYTAIMDGGVEATDAGYILPDGSILPTKGEAIYYPSDDELLALMSPYLSQEPSPSRDIPQEQRDEIEDELTQDLPKKKANPKLIKILGFVIVLMLIRNNKGLKV